MRRRTVPPQSRKTYEPLVGVNLPGSCYLLLATRYFSLPTNGPSHSAYSRAPLGQATWRSAVEKNITIEVHIEEDESTTTVRTVLDLMGDHFEAKGRARRNPVDENMPVVGEELALARALSGLQLEVLEAAQDKIAQYLNL